MILTRAHHVANQLCLLAIANYFSYLTILAISATELLIFLSGKIRGTNGF